MTLSQFISTIDDIAWGPVMLLLLVGTGFYLSIRMGFPQFSRIPYWWKNTAGRLFDKHQAGAGEVTPFQALTTALAATVGTGVTSPAPATLRASPAPSSSADPAPCSGCGSRPSWA